MLMGSQERTDFDKARDSFIKHKDFLSAGARESKDGFLNKGDVTIPEEF
jgi:hypothetical protein